MANEWRGILSRLRRLWSSWWWLLNELISTWLSPLNKCPNVLFVVNKIINKHHLVYLLEVWDKLVRLYPCIYLLLFIYVTMISDSKLCTASIMWICTVVFYRKLLIESIIVISTKNEITVEYIYSGSVHSENLPNQKLIFAGMFFGHKLVLKYWYKKANRNIKVWFLFLLWLSNWYLIFVFKGIYLDRLTFKLP